MSDKKTIRWREPLACKKKIKEAYGPVPLSHKLRLPIFSFICFLAVGILNAGLDRLGYTIFICILASVFLSVLMKFVELIPNYISIHAGGIYNSFTLVPLEKVEVVVLGSMDINGNNYHVLEYMTNERILFTYGISEEVNIHNMACFLESHGVKVEKAQQVSETRSGKDSLAGLASARHLPKRYRATGFE